MADQEMLGVDVALKQERARRIAAERELASTRAATRKALIAVVEDWRHSGQSVDQLLFRMRTTAVPRDEHASSGAEINGV